MRLLLLTKSKKTFSFQAVHTKKGWIHVYSRSCMNTSLSSLKLK